MYRPHGGAEVSRIVKSAMGLLLKIADKTDKSIDPSHVKRMKI